MSENREIKKLLKNIQEGLSLYSLQELNQALVTSLNKKHEIAHEIDCVLDLVCGEFSISKTTLKTIHIRGDLQEAKQIAYCLLHHNLGLSIRYISERIFFNSHTSVANGITKLKNADITHKQDKEFIERYNELQKKLKSLHLK